jgi:hypothetical protein
MVLRPSRAERARRSGRHLEWQAMLRRSRKNPGDSQAGRLQAVRRLRGTRRDVLRDFAEWALLTDEAGRSFDVGLVDMRAVSVQLLADRPARPEAQCWLTFFVADLQFTTPLEVVRIRKRKRQVDEYIWECRRSPSLELSAHISRRR